MTEQIKEALEDGLTVDNTVLKEAENARFSVKGGEKDLAAKKIVPPERGEDETRREYGIRLAEWNKEHQDFGAMNPLSEEERKAVGNKDVKNVIVSGDNLPKSLPEAIDAVRKLDPNQEGFLNDESQERWIYSANNLRHSTIYNHENPELFKAVKQIDEIIKEAKKVCNVPVKEDKWNNVTNAEVYYCPVNIDGKQYSARLTVLTYPAGNVKQAEIHLYNTSMKKESTIDDKVMAPEGGATARTMIDSGYKVKDLIHNTQEEEKKFIGIDDETRFSVRGEMPQRMEGESVMDYAARVDEWNRARVSEARMSVRGGGEKERSSERGRAQSQTAT